MRNVLLSLSGFITIAGIIPYILDVIKRKTKPRIVTWFNWGLLTAIATAAAIAEKQYPSAVLTFAATVATLGVVIFGLRYGERKIEKFEIYCQAGALAGLVLWLIFNKPIVAIIATASIDFIAALPTLRHSWKKPNEETAVAYISGMIGALLAMSTLHKPHFLGLVYPIYLAVMNGILCLLILSGPYRTKRLNSNSIIHTS